MHNKPYKKAGVDQFEVSKTPILQRAHFSPVFMTAPVFTIFHSFQVYLQAKDQSSWKAYFSLVFMAPPAFTTFSAHSCAQ